MDINFTGEVIPRFGHLPSLEEVTPFSECLHFFPFQIRPSVWGRQPLSLHGTQVLLAKIPSGRKGPLICIGLWVGRLVTDFPSPEVSPRNSGKHDHPPPTPNPPHVKFSLMLCHDLVHFQQSAKLGACRLQLSQF